MRYKTRDTERIKRHLSEKIQNQGKSPKDKTAGRVITETKIQTGGDYSWQRIYGTRDTGKEDGWQQRHITRDMEDEECWQRRYSARYTDRRRRYQA